MYLQNQIKPQQDSPIKNDDIANELNCVKIRNSRISINDQIHANTAQPSPKVAFVKKDLNTTQIKFQLQKPSEQSDWIKAFKARYVLTKKRKSMMDEKIEELSKISVGKKIEPPRIL